MKSFLIKNSLLILILLIALFLRFYKLGQNPPGLYWDEAAIGYNAYSILKTAKDEYGNFLPVSFRSFDDYKAPFYIYLTVPSIAVFGLNEFAVRFPSAFFGVLTVLLTYLATREIFKNNKIALFSSLFLAISPWHLQFSRAAFEANLMLFLNLLGFLLFLHFGKLPSKGYKYLIASVISFGLAFNAYHAARIWVPLFLLMITIFYFKKLIGLRLKLIVPAAILILLIFPAVSNFQRATTRAKSVAIFGKPNFMQNFISGYLAHFSPNFLFIAGDQIGRHSIPGFGQLYVFQLPLVILGVISLAAKRTVDGRLLLAWFILSAIPAAVSTPVPHALRSITIVPLWSIITALGTVHLLESKIKNTIRYLLIAAILLIAFYNFATYLHLLWKHYPKLTAPDWQDGYREMTEYVNTIKDRYEKIAITDYYGHPYIYVLFYLQYDPALYQKQVNQNGFDRYEFFGESWEKKVTGPVLVVRPKWQIPEPSPKYLKFIYATNGDLVYRISEE